MRIDVKELRHSEFLFTQGGGKFGFCQRAKRLPALLSQQVDVGLQMARHLIGEGLATLQLTKLRVIRADDHVDESQVKQACSLLQGNGHRLHQRAVSTRSTLPVVGQFVMLTN